MKLEILQTLTQVVAQAWAEASPERACVPSVRGLGAEAACCCPVWRAPYSCERWAEQTVVKKLVCVLL